MPKYKFRIGYEVPYYGDVEIDGETRGQAASRLQEILRRGDPLSHPKLKGVDLAPDFDAASLCSVVLSGDGQPYEPPKPKRKKKPKTKPTFREPTEPTEPTEKEDEQPTTTD
jgi:hypothetical protein